MDLGSKVDPANISDWFWDIIGDASGSREQLKKRLSLLATSDLYRFALEFMFAADLLHGDQLINHMAYASEDNVLDMSHWAVSQGKDFYYSLWGQPQKVSGYPGSILASGTNLYGVAESLIEERTGAWPDDLIDAWEDFSDSAYTQITTFWEEWQVHDSSS
jgi:hypothetical protein